MIGRKGSFGEVHFSPRPCWPIDTTYYVDRSCTDQDLRWLMHRLSGIGLTKINRSKTIPGLNRDDAYRLRLLLPPLAEQRRIAKVLDRAEELRAKRGGALAQLDTLTQFVFLDIFGDPASNPKGWPVLPLREVVKPGTIVTYGIVQAGEEYPGGGIPYIRTGDIADGEIVQSGLRHTDPAIAVKFLRSRVETGEIVMSIRATVGTTALVPPRLDGANLTQGTARIAPGDFVERTYLLQYLRSSAAQHWIKLQIKGATFREITLSRLRQLPVLVPPLSAQSEFARRMAAMEKLRALHRESLSHLYGLFNALQHRAFRGELFSEGIELQAVGKAVGTGTDQ